MAFDDTKTSSDIIPSAEWNAMVIEFKKRLGPVFDVKSFDASPDGGTTTTGSITAATDDLTVASGSTFAEGQGIVVLGAKLDVTDTGNTEDTDNDFTTTGAAVDGEWYARKFTATNSGAVGTVSNVRLKKTGAPAGTCTLSIFADDGGGTSLPDTPFGTAIIGGASDAITNTALNASGAEETFTWSADFPVLVTGVDYWYVIKTIGYTYTDGVTEVIWETDANGAAGLDECAKFDSNGAPTWSTLGANVGANITVNYNLSTTITAITGTAITLAANATVTVSSVLVMHDEFAALSAAHSAATASGGFIFFPAGTYNLGTSITFNADAPLWFDPAATLSINIGITATFFNMIPPTHTVFSGNGSMAFGEQAITAAGDTILADAETVMLNPDADYTMTSTPTIADGTPGQRVVLTAPNAETNTVTVQDQELLAGTNLQLLAPTRDISGKAMLLLQFDGVDWIEMGPTGGMTTLTGGVTIGSGTKHDGYVISDTAEVQTGDAVQTTLDTIALLDENTYHVEAFVVGVQSDGTDRASYHIACTAYRTAAGGATLQGGVTQLHANESNAALDATFTVSGNNLLVRVTGIGAETWEWGSSTMLINMSN